jgi:chloramphenicol O-acetyltransferase type A
MEIVNQSTWKRAEHYKFFHSMDYPQFNICMDIDITNFLEEIRREKLPFYYAMTYATVIVANEIEEFRYRIQGDQVVLHDRIHPSFTEINTETQLFKIVTVELENSMEAFIKKAKEKAEQQTQYFPFQELSRDDLVYITCIPWISFTHLSHTINLRKDDAVPRISWGKYYEDKDKVLLPFSVQVNHALADGLHVGNYIEKLQQYLKNFQISKKNN